MSDRKDSGQFEALHERSRWTGAARIRPCAAARWIGIGVGFLAVVYSGDAAAAEFTVTSAADAGAGTLREAVTLANANAEPDTISFAPALADQTITLTTADDSTVLGSALAVTTEIAIDGGGAPHLTVSASSQRMFFVDAGGTLTIARLTLQGGRAQGGDSDPNRGGTGGGGAGMGGAVFNRGVLIVDAVSFVDNEARGGLGSTNHGGGFCGASAGGPPNGGSAGGFGNPGIPGGPGGFGGGGGGGGCSFNGVAGAGGAGGFGGGGGGGGGLNGGGGTVGTAGAPGFGGSIGTDGTGVLGGSGGNGASLGGAIFNDAGSVSVTNSTFAGNVVDGGGASGFGGAIFSRNGTLSVTSCTFGSNAATFGTSVYVLGDGAAATLTSNESIYDESGTGLAANVTAGGSTSASGSGNIVAMISGVPAGLVGSAAAPNLLALADNGGPTQTAALGAGSSAFNAGLCATVSTDQRGELRPAAGPCDVGAYEERVGDPCTDGAECPNGWCVDGVCCDAACGDDDPNDCQVCSVAMGAVADGSCTPVLDETPCGDGPVVACADPAVCAAGACVAPPSPDGTACDDGLFCTQTDGCAAGVCVGADDPCAMDETCSEAMASCLANCGNGELDGDEECDDGPANSDREPDACRTDCSNPSCGDLVTDSAEECDGGADCNDDCTLTGGSSSSGSSGSSSTDDTSTSDDGESSTGDASDSTGSQMGTTGGSSGASLDGSSSDDGPAATTSGGTSASGADESSGSETDGTGQAGDDGGCACATDPNSTSRPLAGSLQWSLLLLLGWRRRRHRARSLSRDARIHFTHEHR